jgi:hypothetical protein
MANQSYGRERLPVALLAGVPRHVRRCHCSQDMSRNVLSAIRAAIAAGSLGL